MVAQSSFVRRREALALVPPGRSWLCRAQVGQGGFQCRGNLMRLLPDVVLCAFLSVDTLAFLASFHASVQHGTQAADPPRRFSAPLSDSCMS